MGLLDVVDEEDNVIGEADFTEVHERGLRHRSVQIFVFEDESYKDFDRNYNGIGKSRLLVAERSIQQETSKLKLHPSAGGHVRHRQMYEEAAKTQLQDELFYQQSLPALILFSFEKFRNDTRETNKENSMLYGVCYQGPFFPNPKEIQRVFWDYPWNLWEDVNKSPEKYTKTFHKALMNYLFVD